METDSRYGKKLFPPWYMYNFGFVYSIVRKEEFCISSDLRAENPESIHLFFCSFNTFFFGTFYAQFHLF